MTSWPARVRRTRVVSSVATWFNPERWSQTDLFIAVAAIVLIVSLFLPWFKATVRFRNSALSGFLINPPGTVNGITVHAFLWAVFALALLQFVVLAARYVPNGHAFTLPGYRQFLVATSGLICVVVLVASLMKPSTWYAGIDLGGGLYIVVDWSYGAAVALVAALVSLGVAISASRGQDR